MVTHKIDLNSVFSALADPTRRSIVEKLTRNRLCVNELAAGFDMSRPEKKK
ncbi:MAG: winged helix-turn-helix transcriptional regulator [Candidatus Eremiobacteraeota bacterium]|nr:winged helix-turn-helix transcriptional regulator [Candidatus Eremiobacteraeota bacterium]